MAENAENAQTVSLYGRWQESVTIDGATPDTLLTAHLTAPNGPTHRIPGFWDGGNHFAVRFRPEEAGEWKFRLTANVANTADKTLKEKTLKEGTFRCAPAPADLADETKNRFLKHGPVRTVSGKYHFEHADGTPFFWLGDTVWTGPAKATLADWKTYQKERQRKHFTALQFVPMAPWRTAYTDANGDVAFTGTQNVQINPRYFQRMDAFFDAMNDDGFLAVPVLLWAIKGDNNPGWTLSEADCIKLAKYQVARYGAHHVAWILPGDGNYQGDVAERWKRIGDAVFGEHDYGPVTLHPCGTNWPFEAFTEERWLTYFGYQSGHGDSAGTMKWIHSGPPAEKWQSVAGPIIDLEPCYEDHIAYQSRQPIPAYNVRRAVYWGLLCKPLAGVTYGGHGLWSWETEPGKTPLNHDSTGIAKVWSEAVHLPGSADMQRMVEFFTALPDWTTLRPAGVLLTEQPGADDPYRFVTVAASEKDGTIVAYLPLGGPITFKDAVSLGKRRGEWFDPHTGQRQPATPDGHTFTAPNAQDWLLTVTRIR